MVATINRHGMDEKAALPFPPSSSASFASSQDGQRWSGDNLGPRDGYSGLFVSGIMRQQMICSPGTGRPRADDISPTLETDDLPPSQLTPVKASSISTSSPNKTSPFKTPAKGRKRSSIIAATMVTPRHLKSSGIDGGVDAALDNLMRSLKKVALGTPRFHAAEEMPESRWSSSSDDSADPTDAKNSEDASSFWRSRKSSESVRSNKTTRSALSGRSNKGGKKGNKSQEMDRMEVDEQVPPVPAPVPDHMVPVTPSRRKRMMEGIARKLGLTPRKSKQSLAPGETLVTRHIDHDLPAPPPINRPIAKKSSLQTLRSILSTKPSTVDLSLRKKGSVADLGLQQPHAGESDSGLKKKASTTTLRSIMSAHPFSVSNASLPDFSTPIVPVPLTMRQEWNRDVDAGCLPPLTPRMRRTASKKNIGQPKLHPSTSPNTFCREMPRPAPGTPKDEGDLSLVEPVPQLPSDLIAALARSNQEDIGDKSTSSIDSSMAFGVITHSPKEPSYAAEMPLDLATPAHAFGQSRTPLSGSPDQPSDLFTPRPIPTSQPKPRRPAIRPSMAPPNMPRMDPAKAAPPMPRSRFGLPPPPASILQPKKGVLGAVANVGPLKARSMAEKAAAPSYKRSGTAQGPIGIARGKDHGENLVSAAMASPGSLRVRAGAENRWETPTSHDQTETKSSSKDKGDYFSHRPTISLDPSVSDAEQGAVSLAASPVRKMGEQAPDFTISPSKSIRSTFGVDRPLHARMRSDASSSTVDTVSVISVCGPVSKWEHERRKEECWEFERAREGRRRSVCGPIGSWTGRKV